MEQPLLVAARVALLQVAPERGRSASDDGAPGTSPRRAQDMLAQLGLPESLEHLGQGGAHDGGSVPGLG
jgi:hypothetical protein